MSHIIRFCQKDEINLLQEFIATYWKSDHILARDKDLLLWQYEDKREDRINFVVAYNNVSKKFDAILGFIPLRQFDNVIDSNDAWLAIWKVNSEYSSSGIGLKLLLFLNAEYKPESLGVLAFTEDANKIYKAFRYKIGDLTHYYIKNNTFDKTIISKIHRQDSCCERNSDYEIKSLSAFEFRESKLSYNYYPVKTKKYYLNRYFNHPYYKYECLGIYKGGVLFSVFIARRIEVDASICLRIVDWFGSFPSCIYEQIQKLLNEDNAEYIDLICHVPNAHEIINMGFKVKGEKDIIPNYFEPFDKSNVTINYTYKSKREDYAFFKGDSDQDRPNQ